MTLSTIKKKRVSKKTKLSWRKHVNIDDVEDFLEDQRLEERLGPPLETLSNDDLFKVDKTPTEEVLSAKQRKKLKLSRPPKCFTILEPHTKVPDPIKKRNRVRSKEERKNELIKKKEAENRAKGIFKYRELQAIHDREINEKRQKSQPKKDEFEKNIWGDDEDSLKKKEWFSKNTVKHNLVGTGLSRKTVRTPKRPKTSILPSLELPHPGMSYNPSYDDHQDLLKTIAEKEKKVIKEEEHLNRVTRDMFSKVTPGKRDAMWLEEMSQGLPTTPSKQDSDVETDDDYKAINPPTKNKKKTLKQRRKQKEHMKQELMRQTAKLERRKISDIHHLKTLNKQIEKRENRTQILKEKRKKIQQLKKKEPKRLGAIKFEETELEFNMGPDIAGNLRNLKKEGNLLSDRFKSLQKRNIIQPTIRRHRKRSKVKIYTKPDHKDDWITTVARKSTSSKM